MTIDVQKYGLIIGIIGAAAAIVVPSIVYYLQNKKKKLVFEEIQNLAVINVKKDFKDKIEIKYAGKIVHNLFVSTARFKNKGSLSIKENDIIKPIEIIFVKKILEADVIEVSPKCIEVQLDTISEGKSVQCKFNLLNPNDYFTLQFVSLEKLSTPEINPRIEGLSKIDIVGSNGVQSYNNIAGITLPLVILTLSTVLFIYYGRPIDFYTRVVLFSVYIGLILITFSDRISSLLEKIKRT